MSRTVELLEKAADALDDGRDPFALPFLAENDVTYDEHLDLAGMLAVGARLLAYGIGHPKVAAGAVNGAGAIVAYEALNAALAHLPAKETEAS